MSVLKQFDLSGKTALVTGYNKGIGKGMALGDNKIEKEVIALGKKFKANQSSN